MATIITVNCASQTSCTLDELASGGSIAVNDKVFDNWAVSVDESDIDVTVSGLDDGGLDPGPGLFYELDVNFNSLPFIGLDFTFDVSTIDNVARIKDNSLMRGDFFIPPGDDGSFIIAEEVLSGLSDPLGVKCVGRGIGLEASLQNQAGLTCTSGDPNGGDFARLDFAPQSTISVRTVILGDGFLDGIDVRSFTQRFSQIPTPGTLILFGLGLAGLRLTRGVYVAAR